MGNADAKVGSGGWRNVFKDEDGKGDGSGEGGMDEVGRVNGGGYENGANGQNGCWVGDAGAARRAWERRGGDGRGLRACDGAETWRREQR